MTTLLEQFDAARYWEDLPDSTAIRRAIAIAQAFDEAQITDAPKSWIQHRAEELLRGEP